MFKDARGKILYIGKATILAERVRSYFASDLAESRGQLLVRMLAEASKIEWQETDSVLEALILEANLIKKHQPRYNTRERGNTSFNYLVITKEDFPRVLVVRGRELFSTWNDADIKYLFGPFPSGSVLREALKIVRKIFPFRDTCSVCAEGKQKRTACKPCFNRQIGLCPGVCTGETTKREYAKTIQNIKLFFEGKKGTLLAKIEKEMRTLAQREHFEEASVLRNQIYALEHLKETALLGSEFKVARGDGSAMRIESYDVAHISETARVGVYAVLEDGETKKSEYRLFNITTASKGDTAALREVLGRRLAHSEWQLPTLIVVDGGKAQINAARRVVSDMDMHISVVGVVKDEHHKPKAILGNSALIAQHEKEILLANAEAHRFAINAHKKKRTKTMLK